MSEGAQRAVPYYCPFCGEEQFLRPHAGPETDDDEPAPSTHGQWECRACRRVFALKMLGLLGRETP
ncbi:hypothetical protein Cs7R123_74650 [Catellatospora sp. TT07R-123]|uniref:hypothetical protein n=1 Tax=Catellatospora sp. TT07R-123 TaxID=2733863 RepID=UPI001B000FB9|nr:hypothetical protein [Catellatospora sp. TT07R-123]GHJ50123.1 hypothetical protein Cs7R123_74650 [Catellatospora sp. TT07R-123]